MLPPEAPLADPLDPRTALMLIGAVEELSRRVDVDGVASVVVAWGARLVPGAECALALADRGNHSRLRLVAASGGPLAAMVGRDQPLEGTLSGRALATGRPVDTENAPADSPVAREMVSGAPRSARLVPLTSGVGEGPADVLGVVGFYRDTAFTAAERAVMVDYGLRVSVAVHRALLLDDARRTARRLQLSLDVALDVGGELAPQVVMERLVARAAAAVDADRASLSRLEGGDAVLEASAALRGPTITPGIRWPIDAHPLLRDAVRAGEPIREQRGGTGTVPSSHPELSFAELTQIMTVPMAVGGEVIAILGVSRTGERPFDDDDVATLRQLGAVAALMLRQVRLLHSRSVFMNMAAHELRTPISVINGYLSMLLDGTFGAPPPGWEQPLAILAERNRELRARVEDLLLEARLDAGRVRSDPVAIDLRALAGDVVRAAAQVDLAGGSVRLADLPPTPVVVRADASHVRRIVDNLVANACAYTGATGVAHVRVAVSAGDGWGRLTVEDRGAGIPEPVRSRVFERFFRHEEGATRFVPGTGLGLSIGRELAERSGGTLRLDWSEVGRGSRFLLELPLFSAEHEA